MIQETFPMIIGEEEIPNERALLTQEDGPMMASSASVKYIVIHCSATRSTRDYTAEQLLRDHKTRGFRSIHPIYPILLYQKGFSWFCLSAKAFAYYSEKKFL